MLETVILNSLFITMKKIPHDLNQYLIIFPFAILYIASFCLSYIAAPNCEDYWHMAAQTPGEAFYLAQYSFMHWNSRLGDLLSYFIGDSAEWFDIIVTPLSVVLVAYLLYRWTYFLTNEQIRKHRVQTASISCLLTGSLCSFFSWYCSNLNWFIPCALSLLALWFLRHYFSTNRAKLIIIIPLFFIVGWSNEVIALMLIILFSLFISFQYLQRKEVSSKAVFAILISLTLGFCLSIHGSIVRQSTVDSTIGLLDRVLKIFSLPDIIYFGISFSRCFLIILMIFILGGLDYIKNQLFTKTNFLLVSVFLLTLACLSQAPTWGAPRSYHPLYLIFFLLILIESVKSSSYFSGWKRIVFYTVLLFATVTPWISTYANAWVSAKQRERIIAALQEQKASGLDHVILPSHVVSFKPYSFMIGSVRIPHIILSPVYGGGTLSSVSSFVTLHPRLPNEEFAREQGVLSVSVKDSEE